MQFKGITLVAPENTGDNTRKGAISRSQLVDDLRLLGIKSGDLLHAKISLRSVGWIEGGAGTLLDAILEVLGPEGTLVSDAFIPMYPLPLSKDNAGIIATDQSATYAGAFCRAMVEHPSMVRSQHPVPLAPIPLPPPAVHRKTPIAPGRNQIP